MNERLAADLERFKADLREKKTEETDNDDKDQQEAVWDDNIYRPNTHT